MAEEKKKRATAKYKVTPERLAQGYHASESAILSRPLWHVVQQQGLISFTSLLVEKNDPVPVSYSFVLSEDSAGKEPEEPTMEQFHAREVLAAIQEILNNIDVLNVDFLHGGRSVTVAGRLKE
ncbi:hypothetical protein [Corynebacterium mastitidis]|uniref:hypothetical protein n=1 Tax=Corynebacterium mastitidis TaxID=161890 RepID=UPI0003669ACB|nr:hypothetical protein [Corynebacterium mastitidis]